MDGLDWRELHLRRTVARCLLVHQEPSREAFGRREVQAAEHTLPMLWHWQYLPRFRYTVTPATKLWM